jgi:hypothetical protein
MVKAMQFGEEEPAYVRSLGFGAGFLEYLARFASWRHRRDAAGHRSLVRNETIEQMSDRARAELRALPPGLRDLETDPVSYSERCRAALQAVDARVG